MEQLHKATILVIDDEESIRQTFTAFLSREGYSIVTARDFRSALDAISSTTFDLILTDILLGPHSGVDILKEVKAQGLQCPVIMITGEPDIDSAAAALRLGAFDYLPKPIRKDTLIRVTKHALQHKALLDEKAVIESERERYRSHLEAIFRSVEDAIITVDNDMRIIEANEATESICMISPKGLMWDISRKGCSRTCWKVLEEALTTRRSVKEYRIECGNPKRPQQVVTITVSPLRDRKDASIGAVMIIRDITRLSHLEKELQDRNHFHAIIGKNKRMQEIYNLLENLKDIDTTVLITGPSGTGKELVARAIHYDGARADKPFVVVNCSALAENLLESELFGHIKGAFTGAVRDKEGRFQLANKGTIFLDEIGDISPRIQLKLLRVLETKEFERVGDSRTLRMDAQVVTATNCDLLEKVRRGEFREDLYYRLKVVEINIPPLCERKDDIPLLLDHYVSVFRKRFNKTISGVAPEVERLFMDYPWPGNIRELIHTLEHAFVVCRKPLIDLEDLPPEVRGYETPATLPEKTSGHGVQDVMAALEKAGGNKAGAARILGISRQTLYRKIKDRQNGNRA
ncbi:MAG: sigma-54-dependent Fis family transcriptional regulator [Syntrophaceae bacterium]|nr:sigma-54-dependent Fis family transcriptional regulator [Deltaproteobacteria bacterium]